ncbi:uncharacterized protein LOC111025451 [Momordica charantia]|uniref:Uncharacterized protein LOC111025451 n=1 Tax=Momordica charantia TaxID=3673 RepID=A0A6J1DXF3_MOMCH|nr:uncharacterized protein LOC111025451 [Momordica charantia]
MEELRLVGSSDYPNVFSCIGTTRFIKKDMKILDDKDVYWLHNVTFNGAVQCCSLVVDCRNCLSNVLDRMPINISSSIDNGIPSIGQFHHSIDVANISANFHIEVNDKFCGNRNLQNALRSMAIRDNFQFRTIKSNRYVALWTTTILNDHRQATFSVIKEFIKDRINIFGTDLLSVKDVISHVRELGTSINYHKVWRAKEYAIKEIRGSPEESYALILSFCHMIKMKNPGSVCDFKVDNHGSLHLDANDQIFPLAFCVVDSENDTSWVWFFEHLKPCIGVRQNLVIVSNRHKSIVKSVEKVFTTAFHCICAYHLFKNLKLKYKEKISDKLFFRCAKAYNIEDFEHNMRLLDSTVRGLREELSGIGFSKWSCAYSRSSRYNFMTTNISESLNAAMKDAR